jgi:hypothetical protein
MKKIFAVLGIAFLIAFAITISCQKDKTIPSKDVCIEQWEVYNTQLLTLFNNAPTMIVNGIPEQVLTSTPEVEKLITLRNQAINESKAIRPMLVATFRWFCYCPQCGWCGNTYPCATKSTNPCGGWQCGRCYWSPLSTGYILCEDTRGK